MPTAAIISSVLKATTITASSYSQPATQFFNRAGQLTDARKTLYDTLITSLISASVWTLLDGIYVMAASDDTTARTNLRQSNYGLTVNGSLTFTTDVGYTGDGTTGYLSSGFNPTSATSPQFTLNSASLFAWCNSSAAQATYLLGNPSDSRNRVQPRLGGFNLSVINVNTSGNVSVSNTDGRGLHTGSRTASNLTTAYLNTTAGGTSASTPTLTNNEFTFFRSQSTYSSQQCLGGGWGAGLTAQNITDLYDALHIYLQTVAGIA